MFKFHFCVSSHTQSYKLKMPKVNYCNSTLTLYFLSVRNFVHVVVLIPVDSDMFIVLKKESKCAFCVYQ